MTPESKQVMHEAIIRALDPKYLEPPYIIDWETVTTSNYYEEPWSYSEYTAGGGNYWVSISGDLLAEPDDRPSWETAGRLDVGRTLSPSEFGEFVSELFR